MSETSIWTYLSFCLAETVTTPSFFVLALNIGSEDVACVLAKKLLDQVAKPIPGIPDHSSLGVSIGICLFPYQGMTVSDMIHRADEAMYQVKNSGKSNFAFTVAT